MKKILINNVEIDIYDDRPVGVCVSGGADSAILLYILLSNIKNHLQIYTMMSPERRPAIESHVDSIVNTCKELTGNSNFTLHKNAVAVQSPDSLFQLCRDKLDSKEVDIIYFGLTKFPPTEIYEQWEEKQPQWHIDARNDSVIRPMYGMCIPIDENTDTTWLTSEIKDKIEIDQRAYVPFVNLNKKDIADLYNACGVLDQLFPKTRSCETQSHIGSHCGKCWWCEERLWAFGCLDG